MELKKAYKLEVKEKGVIIQVSDYFKTKDVAYKCYNEFYSDKLFHEIQEVYVKKNTILINCITNY